MPSNAPVGRTFQAANGIGTYKITKAASSTTDNVQVSYAPDGKTYVALPAMPFAQFVTLVKAPAAAAAQPSG
jgi:hypothetical protein